MSSRGRWLRELEKLATPKADPSALSEVFDYIDEVYGDVVRKLGNRVLALYNIAALYLIDKNPELFRKITRELTDLLEEAASSRNESLSPETKKKVRELLAELEEFARKAVGG